MVRTRFSQDLHIHVSHLILTVFAASVLGSITASAMAQDFSVDRSSRVIIYLDPALTSHEAQLKAVQSLAERAEDLLAFGSVEIVRSVTAPTHLLGPSHDLAAIQDVLYSLAATRPINGSVAELRRTFLNERAAEDPSALRERVRQSARREISLLSERLGVLRHWVAMQPSRPAPTAFLWITDGFDVEMSEFYVRASGGTLRRELESDLEPYELHGEMHRLVLQLMATGFTTLPLAAHRSELKTGHMTAPWIDALEPLRVAAVNTGGFVISNPAEMPTLLAELEDRWALTYYAENSYTAPANTTSR